MSRASFFLLLTLTSCQVGVDSQETTFVVENEASWVTGVREAANNPKADNHESAKALMAIVKGADVADCSSCHDEPNGNVWTAKARLCFGIQCGLEGTLKSLAVYHQNFENHIAREKVAVHMPSKVYFSAYSKKAVLLAYQFTNDKKRETFLRTGPVCSNSQHEWRPDDARKLRYALRSWMLRGAWLPEEAYSSARADFEEALELR